jgi:hypothetical protein
VKEIERYRDLFVNREDAMGGSLNVQGEKDKGQGDQSQPHIGKAANMGATPLRFGVRTTCRLFLQ